MSDGRPPRPEGLPPGYDETDPYADDDLASYPDWWRENVELFRDHAMRPYRPPQFRDGEITTIIIDSLEEELGIEIRLRAVDPQAGGDWEIRVDDIVIDTVARTRTEGGYSQYALTSTAFEKLVRDACSE